MSVFFDSGDDQRRQQLQRQRAGPAGGAGGGRGEGGALPGHQGAGPGGDQAYYHVTIPSSYPHPSAGERQHGLFPGLQPAQQPAGRPSATPTRLHPLQPPRPRPHQHQDTAELGSQVSS